MAQNETRTFDVRCLHLPSPDDALEALEEVGVDPYGIEAMLPKMSGLNLLLEGIECRTANIVKQEMLSLGGDAAVARGTVGCSIPRTDVILMGTTKQLRRFAEKMALQPFGLRDLSDRIWRLLLDLARKEFPLTTAKRRMVLGGRTWIMGIVNVTPDSFSDGGRFTSPEKAVACGRQLVEDGADILDVGGESSRPGALPVSLDEELKRVIPVIQGLAQTVSVPISVDTTKAAVAREAVACGAEIVNDISALQFDPGMAAVIGDLKPAVILMHMRGTPRDMQKGELAYRSVPGEMVCFLEERIRFAESQGIATEQILIDPGIGFGKTGLDNLRILNRLAEFKALGRPVVTGVSRKAFIGGLTGDPPEGRFEGTLAALAAAILRGTHIIRVHDVRAAKKVAAVADAIARA